MTLTKDEGTIDRDDGRRIDQATVVIVDALKAAADEASGVVESAELGRRITTLTWVVEMNDGEDDIEVSVDASTGEVSDVDRD